MNRGHLVRTAFFVAASLTLMVSAVPVTAQAYTVTVSPANPTTYTPITIRIASPWLCGEPITWSRTGNTIRVNVPPACVIILPPAETTDVSIGTLPAGTYTYEVYTDTVVTHSGTIVVAQAVAPIPALSEIALGALGMALLAIGWLVVGRRT